MLQEGSRIADGSELSAQVCVVGTGPAGVTLAWYLQEAGLDVLLLEGSRDLSQAGLNENQWLYAGQCSGQLGKNEPEFLTLPTQLGGGSAPSERERTFGGTSVHWGGQSRPLNPVVFEARGEFPAWPIQRGDLDPYYAEYCRLMHLYGEYFGPRGEPGHNFTAEFWAQELGRRTASLEGFEEVMYQFPAAEWLRFATRRFGTDAQGRGGCTIGESRARVIRNASLLEIVHQGRSVDHLEVASIDDDLRTPKRRTSFTVKADVYVLACGAIANARQLLLSELGNAHDHVGRYFMGQPWPKGSGIVVDASSYLDPDQQFLFGYPAVDEEKYGIHAVVAKFEPTAAELNKEGIGGCWFKAGGSIVYYETSPHPENRVVLADSKDPVFGQRQTHITWSPTTVDQRTYEVLSQRFVTSVREAAAKKGGAHTTTGSPVVPEWAEIVPKLIVNGHHIGTTRMSRAPEDGVVNADLRLHDVDNLFVAGSSVFPSAGLSNPTMTIVALSIRLAEHLGGVLGARRAGGA